MEHIRIKISIHLNQNHALTEKDLNAFKPAMERAIAGSLPASINVDTVKVTKIKEVASATAEDCESDDANKPMLHSASKSGDRAPSSKDVPALLHFEFQGAEHTVELLTSRSSTNVVMKVDGVTHRSHVTLCEGVKQEDWLDDAQLISFAKRAIDPEYGVMTPKEVEELLREGKRLRRSGKSKP